MLAGGDFWPPLAKSIAGGVCGATILALFFPSGYVLVMCRGCPEIIESEEPAVEIPRWSIKTQNV
jgi:hypothetical protein